MVNDIGKNYPAGRVNDIGKITQQAELKILVKLPSRQTVNDIDKKIRSRQRINDNG